VRAWRISYLVGGGPATLEESGDQEYYGPAFTVGVDGLPSVSTGGFLRLQVIGWGW